MWVLKFFGAVATAALAALKRRNRDKDAGNPEKLESLLTDNNPTAASAYHIRPTRAQRGRSRQQIAARQARQHTKASQRPNREIAETGSSLISTQLLLREIQFPNMAGPRYRIEYTDHDGVVTERDIIVQWINAGAKGIYVTAFCEMRGEVRSFKGERIIAMTDAASGSKISHPVRYLHRLGREL
ncbi:hypothetical protein [Pseudolabrys taiwanensis]|uniref:hypothetical protein n=1 Tax=Pseudolabrys taiwanensis TaxID=331696 RepID=UPI0013B3F8BE|nr:hypothetical protein [Pseudolabrys taiwanensis]